MRHNTPEGVPLVRRQDPEEGYQEEIANRKHQSAKSESDYGSCIKHQRAGDCCQESSATGGQSYFPRVLE